MTMGFRRLTLSPPDIQSTDSELNQQEASVRPSAALAMAAAVALLVITMTPSYVLGAPPVPAAEREETVELSKPGQKRVKVMVKSQGEQTEGVVRGAAPVSPENAMQQLQVLLKGLTEPVTGSIAGGKLILEGTIKTQADKLWFEQAIAGYPDVINNVRVEAPEVQIGISATLIEVEESSGNDLMLLDKSHFSLNGDFGMTGQKVHEEHGYYQEEDDYSTRSLSWRLGLNTELLQAVRFLVERGKAKIIATPQVVTINGRRATLLAGAEKPYESSSIFGSNVEFKPVGVILDVVPNLLPSGEVMLDMTIESSNRDLDVRRAKMEVAVEGGKSLVVAGLSSTTTSSRRQVGCLFPIFARGGSYRRTELLAIVTPDAPSIVGFDRLELIKPEDLNRK